MLEKSYSVPFNTTIYCEISDASFDSRCDLIARCVGHAEVKNVPLMHYVVRNRKTTLMYRPTDYYAASYSQLSALLFAETGVRV
jgi:hypothetical protein